MPCQNCGASLKKILPTNICSQCNRQICPKCGSDDWDPELLPPKDKNDVVGLVFGLKPYAKCSKCGNIYKDSMLVSAERKANGLRVLSASQYQNLEKTFYFGVVMTVCGILGTSLCLLMQRSGEEMSSVIPWFLFSALVGIIAIIVSKHMLSDD